MIQERNRGFSLLEVLIALAILSVGLLAVARLQVAAIQSLSYSRHLSTATQLGEEQLEVLRSLPFIAIFPNQAPQDQNGAIQSYLNGTAVSPFAGDATENDGIASGWHSHWNNPMNAMGERSAPGEMIFFVRWTIERGPRNMAKAGHVFGVPGIGQIRIRLQVIWWENNKARPASLSHAAVSSWDNVTFKSTRAHVVELEAIRQ